MDGEQEEAYSMTLGELIAHKRTEKHVSQSVLAEMAGITQVTLWQIETGRTRRPQEKTLKNLGIALGLKPGYLSYVARRE